MRKIMIAAAALGLVGCATVSNETRVPAGFTAREFNTITSRYEERPTFARVQSMSSGSEILRIEMDQYGSTASQYYGMDYNHTIPFRRAEAPQYQAAIERFLEWEATARERGDILDGREIDRVSAFNGGAIRFSLYSGNASAHFLMMTYCAVGTCLESDSLFLDRAGAEGLHALMSRWLAGELVAQSGDDLDAIYR